LVIGHWSLVIRHLSFPSLSPSSSPSDCGSGQDARTTAATLPQWDVAAIF